MRLTQTEGASALIRLNSNSNKLNYSPTTTTTHEKPNNAMATSRLVKQGGANGTPYHLPSCDNAEATLSFDARHQQNVCNKNNNININSNNNSPCDDIEEVTTTSAMTILPSSQQTQKHQHDDRKMAAYDISPGYHQPDDARWRGEGQLKMDDEGVESPFLQELRRQQQEQQSRGDGSVVETRQCQHQQRIKSPGQYNDECGSGKNNGGEGNLVGLNTVRRIACFLSLADCGDLAALQSRERTVYEELEEGQSYSCGERSSSVTTTSRMIQTPSPEEELPRGEQRLVDDGQSQSQYTFVIDDGDKERLELRHKIIIQKHLTEAVFSHPKSLRSFCLDAHRQAECLNRGVAGDRGSGEAVTGGEERFKCNNGTYEDPETLREPPSDESYLNRQRREVASVSINLNGTHHQFESREDKRVVRILLGKILQNVPLSVVLQLFEGVFETTFQTTIALYKLTSLSIRCILQTLSHLVIQVCDRIQSLNPVSLVQALFQMQKNALETTASGIVSVANSVGAAVNVSSKSGSVAGLMGDTASGFFGTRLRTRSIDKKMISEKMFRRLSRYDNTSKVVSYLEREDDVLTQHAKMRVQRMMHYDVSLRPFVATVIAPHPQTPPSISPTITPQQQIMTHVRNQSLRSILANHSAHIHQQHHTPSPPIILPSRSSSSISTPNSPFMCTPKSFPPTPSSRSLVMARSTRFAEDVIFLARDQLRLEDALASTDEKTRAMAAALRQGSRLAVLNANDTANGIVLTKGQHCAMKVDGSMYSGTRGMIPLLRNCWVYFEVTVMGGPGPAVPSGLLNPGAVVASLSTGISTLRMPLDQLVGMWKGSVGICTSGQILAGGQLCSSGGIIYGNNSTVGCLVYIDDRSAMETWDGVMVATKVMFNIDGVPVALNEVLFHREQCSLQILVLREEEVYPTITLHSPATQVMCHFCAEDVLATSRLAIGAPEGVPVYAVDGSVIFKEEDDTILDTSFYTTDADDDDEDYGSDDHAEDDDSAYVPSIATII